MLDTYLTSLLLAMPGATPPEAVRLLRAWLWLQHCRRLRDVSRGARAAQN